MKIIWSIGVSLAKLYCKITKKHLTRRMINPRYYYGMNRLHPAYKDGNTCIRCGKKLFNE